MANLTSCSVDFSPRKFLACRKASNDSVRTAKDENKGKLWERATVHALLRLPRGSNKRDDIALGAGRGARGAARRWGGKSAGVRRERSQPYSGNMFRNCFTSDGTEVGGKGRKTRRRKEGSKEKIKMFRRSFVREPCVARCFLPRRAPAE